MNATRACLISLGLLLAATAPATGQALARGGPATRQATWQDTTYIDAIIRLDLESGPTAVLPALTYNTKLMLPVRQYFELAEIRMAAFAVRDSAVAVLEPGAVTLRFKPSARLLMLGDDSVRYDSLDVVWWEGELFVTSTVLDRLLATSTSVEWNSLSATVGHTAALPVIQRLRREHRREMVGQHRRPSPDVLDLALRNRPVDGMVGSWNVTAMRRGPTEQLTLDLGIGAQLLGGSAELRPLFFAADNASDAQLRWSWWKTWPEAHGIRQVRIGDVQSGGVRSRLMTGAIVTNAPFIRSSEFDVEHLVTNVPAGWEAELYEGGQLLAYSEADAVGAFRVPLQLGYGQNPYELVLYGPGGATVRKTRTIRVPFSRLPNGHLEYAVSAGQCRYDPCDAMFSADARYGLSSRVTLQGGWDAFLDHAQNTLYQPYAVLSGAVLPSLALTGEAVVNDHMRATANFEPSLDVRATAGFTRYLPSGARLSGAFTEMSRTEGSLFWRPTWHDGALIVQGAGLYSTGPGQHRDLQRVSATTRYGRWRYGLGLLRDHQTRNDIGIGRFAVDASADAALSGPWQVLREATVQGSLGFEPANGLSAVRGGIGRRVGRAVRLDAAVGWLRGAGMNIELAFTTATPGPRFGARSRATMNAGSEALVYASGSVAWDPRTRLTQLSDLADLGRAGVSGVLFQDDNANGRQDPGEAGIPNIPVHIGGWPAETDAHGRFAAWGMYASEPVQIDVDTLSFGNPQLVMPAPVLRVRPSPNSFGVISVPVMVGGEISGFVLFDGQPVAGVALILREMNTGAEVRTTTFQDGGFYRGAVPPGEYEVTLPDAVLDRLKANVPALSIFVPPGAGEKRFEDLTLRLERRP